MTDCHDDTKDLNILTNEFSDEALETASGIGANKLGTLMESRRPSRSIDCERPRHVGLLG
jgi:hypothetical protein